MVGHQDDIVIAVIGSTSTGKSSFIRLLSGTDNVGDSLERETSDIQIISFRDSESGRHVKIADCPSFDDSAIGVSDTDIPRQIAEFLFREYDGKRHLNGLVYLQRSSDPSFDNQSDLKPEMLYDLCDTKNVVVLMTFWDQHSGRQGEGQEEQLNSRFSQDLLQGGAHFMQHNGTVETACNVLRHILTLVPTDTHSEGKAAKDTAAEYVHREEVERIIAKHNRDMGGLKDELEMLKKVNNALEQDLEDERARLQQESARWEEERAEFTQDHEKRRQEQEHKWRSQFNDQGERAREFLEMAAKSEEETRNELEETRKGNSSLSQELEEERARMQRVLVRWVDERAELKKCLDEAKIAQMRIKDDFAKERTHREKMHWEEMKRMITKHQEEMAALEYKNDMVKISNHELRHECKEERARAQLNVARWEAERAELKDAAMKPRRWMETGTAKGRVQHQELHMPSRFEKQENKRDGSI